MMYNMLGLSHDIWIWVWLLGGACWCGVWGVCGAGRGWWVGWFWGGRRDMVFVLGLIFEEKKEMIGEELEGTDIIILDSMCFLYKNGRKCRERTPNLGFSKISVSFFLFVYNIASVFLT